MNPSGFLESPPVYREPVGFLRVLQFNVPVSLLRVLQVTVNPLICANWGNRGWREDEENESDIE